MRISKQHLLSIPIFTCILHFLLKNDVYNANSRSKEISLIPSFSSKDHVISIKREDINDNKNRIFILKEFLTKEECNHLINECENIGFETSDDIKDEYPKEYRNSERMIILNNELANNLWNRLKYFIKNKDFNNMTPYGFNTQGIWIPVRLNNCFLFTKYKENTYFKTHYDGMYKNNLQECSIFTFTLYLNDNFKGGNLIFRDEDKSILQQYRPTQGDAVLFNHDCLHEGETVTEGIKYIFRTSVMFSKLADLSDNERKFEKKEQWQYMRSVFKSFDYLASLNDALKFTSSFLEVQKIQLSENRCIHPKRSSHTSFKLPKEIIEEIFLYLFEPKDVLNLGLVCFNFYQITMKGNVWRNLYKSHFDKKSVDIIEKLNDIYFKKENQLFVMDTDLVRWFTLFKAKYILRKNVTPVIMYLGEKLRVKPAYSNKEDNELNDDYNEIRDIYATAYRDTDPWDYSFSNFEVGDDNGYYWTDGDFKVDWYDPVFPELVVYSYDYLSSVANPTENPLIVVTLPYLWSASSNDKDKIFKVVRQCDTKGYSYHYINNRNKKEIIANLVDRLQLPAIYLVDAGVCALSHFGKTSGTFIYCHEFSNDNETSRYFICYYNNSRIVDLHKVLEYEQEKINYEEIIKVANEVNENKNDNLLVIISDKERRDEKLINNLLKNNNYDIRFIMNDDLVNGAKIFSSCPFFESSSIFDMSKPVKE
ncbi:hypothetical protein ABK040_011128 [Willaertia magna]